MTPEVNNMADNETETDTSSQIDENQENIRQTAQEEVLKAMNNAMDNLPERPNDSEPSEFLKKNLSVEQVVEENIEYVEPMQDPYNKAIKYLENHNVLQLFQQLTASIVYTKPEKPLDFMVQQVEKMKKEKEEEEKKEKEKKQKS